MTKKAKIALPILFLLTACEQSSYDTYLLMIETYQNPENFVSYNGYVTSYDSEKNEIYIECYLENWSNKEKEYLFGICSDSSLPLFENDFVEFKTHPHMFRNVCMHFFYIVEIIKDNEVLLSFEDGQRYLLNSLYEKLENC